MAERTGVLLLGALLVACSGAPPRATTPAPRPALDSSHVGVALFGRSVTEGWFAHWGVKPGRGYQRGRFRLLHRPFDPTDPDAVEWPNQIDAELQRFSRFLHAVHYKLCFVDFRDHTDLGPYRELVERVYRVVVVKHKRRLIIGNALPAVKSASTPRVVALHREYNDFLSRFASRHRGVSIFDQHRVLADAQGALRAEYAFSPTDSHLNEKGYAALDSAYFAFLQRHFAK